MSIKSWDNEGVTIVDWKEEMLNIVYLVSLLHVIPRRRPSAVIYFFSVMLATLLYGRHVRSHVSLSHY